MISRVPMATELIFDIDFQLSWKLRNLGTVDVGNECGPSGFRTGQIHFWHQSSVNMKTDKPMKGAEVEMKKI